MIGVTTRSRAAMPRRPASCGRSIPLISVLSQISYRAGEDDLQAATASNCSFSVGVGFKAKRPWRLRIM